MEGVVRACQKWLCPTPSPPVVEVSSYLNNWTGHVLKIFILFNYVLLAYHLCIFIFRRTVRMLNLHRRVKLNAVRNISTSTSMERYVDDIDTAVKDTKLEKALKRTIKKSAANWTEKDINHVRPQSTPAKFANYLYYEKIASVARNARTLAASWIKPGEIRDVLIGESKPQQNDKVVKILLCRRNMSCETDSVFSTLSGPNRRESNQIGLANEKTQSNRLYEQKVDSGRCIPKYSAVSCCPVQHLSKRRSEPKRQRTRYSLRSAQAHSTRLVDSQSGVSTENVARSHRGDRGDHISRSVLLHIASSEMTVRNESGRDRCRSGSQSRSGTPKVQIEFNVKKRSGMRCKMSGSGMGDRSCTKCGKCFSGHHGKRNQHGTVFDRAEARAAQKLRRY